MRALVFGLAAILMIAAPAGAETLPAGATAAKNEARIVVPVRTIARGDIIAPDDLTYAKVPPGQLLGGAVTQMSALTGKQARRMLIAGTAVRASDVRVPILVTKGSTVTMTFHAPGITLTAVGKAMSEGGLGEAVTVLNPVSYRQITATVTGPGMVMAAGGTLSIQASNPAQFASAQN